jgi:hypothetical protein
MMTTTTMTTPHKRVLALYFSQTGQLKSVLDQVLHPLLADATLTTTVVRLDTEPAAPFPWPFFRFFDTFPETVLQKPMPLQMAALADEPYDVIMLAYPIWFLSPPPALTAFLHSEQAARVLRGRPVVTLIACRNMWVMAQESVKKQLQRLQARHLDNIVLTDQSGTFASFITTPRWMFTGRKNAFWGLPPAGVPDHEITAARRFGHALRAALHADQERGEQALLTGLAACRVDPRLISSEKVGLRSFTIWGKLLHRVGRPGSPLRRAVLTLYIVFLLCLIVTVVPITMVLKTLLRPLLKRRLAQQQAFYEQPSGSGIERMAQFAGKEVQES